MKNKQNYQTALLSDNFLISLHLLFIIFSFSFALRAPFYLGFMLIILHKAHEIYFGECYLTLLQQRYGYSGKNDDFFYHLFSRLNIKVKRNLSQNIHLAIKTIILLIVIFKSFNYFDIF